VASRLPPEDEARAFQRRADLSAGQVCRQLRQELPLRCGGSDFDEFPSGLHRYRLAGVEAVVQIKPDRFPDIGKGLIAAVPLTNAAGQGRRAGHVATVCFLFQDYGVPHGHSPWG